MSQKVAVYMHEFDTLKSEIEILHEDIIENVQSVVEEISNLVSYGGSINTTEFSPKVQQFTDALKDDVLYDLISVFLASEETIKDYHIMLIGIDSTN